MDTLFILAVVANTIGKFITLGDVAPALSLTVLVCGLIGAVVVAVGTDHVAWGFSELLQHGKFNGITKVLLALVLSPLIGFWAGFWLHRLMLVLLRAARPSANRYLRLAQFGTAAGLAFSHGANDV